MNLDRARFIESMQAQAAIGGTDNGGLHRLALSSADGAVREWFHERMINAGLDVRVDAFGNMFGRRNGTDPDAAPILVGSHLDSQPYGGIYDGALGVVAALELIETLNDEGIETVHPIEIVNWTNEEGSRFQPTLQGSGVWAGAHDLETQYESTDADGNRLVDELEAIGFKGDAPVGPQEPYEAYLELHVEQGPSLDTNDIDVGIVTGIVGLVWGAATFYGSANHSGATPMQHRHDALVAAADVITQVRRIPGAIGEKTVGTVGYVDVSPNSINVIPGEVTITWGFRDPEDENVSAAKERVLREIEMAAEREGIKYETEIRSKADSVAFDTRCIDAIRNAADGLGYESMEVFSGGVHDATHLTSICDTGMVFAVSEDGKSHPEEAYTSWDDCYNAANTLANAALEIATRIDSRTG